MMNLPVILTKILAGAKVVCKSGALVLKQNSDKVFIGIGIAGFGLTVIETVHATNKTNDILEEKETALAETKQWNNQFDYEQYEKDWNRHTRKRLIWIWLPVAGTFVASVIFVGKGYNVVNGKYAAAAAAYESLDAFTQRYRENVIDEFGRDVDWRMAHSMKKEDYDAMKQEDRENLQIKEDNATRKKKARLKNRWENERKYLIDPDSCEYWKRWWTPREFLDWLLVKQKQADDKLQLEGYIFENDILEMLGMKKTCEGQITGIIKRHGSEPAKHVSFGIDEMPEDELRRILGTQRNEELKFWLDLNSDGIIYNKIN